jgi:hypothetical protein
LAQGYRLGCDNRSRVLLIVYDRILKRMREKYLVQGQTIAHNEVVIVSKLSPIGKLVIITVYLA